MDGPAEVLEGGGKAPPAPPSAAHDCSKVADNIFLINNTVVN